jgi:hypothetical protein
MTRSTRSAWRRSRAYTWAAIGPEKRYPACGTTYAAASRSSSGTSTAASMPSISSVKVLASPG